MLLNGGATALRGQGGYLGVRLWKISLNTLLIEGVMVVI